MHVEVAWALVSSGTQVQPQIIASRLSFRFLWLWLNQLLPCLKIKFKVFLVVSRLIKVRLFESYRKWVILICFWKVEQFLAVKVDLKIWGNHVLKQFKSEASGLIPWKIKNNIQKWLSEWFLTTPLSVPSYDICSSMIGGYIMIVTVVHSAVFTGHLVYACVVVALIFRDNNSLIMRRELSPLIKKIREFITETYEKT